MDSAQTDRSAKARSRTKPALNRKPVRHLRLLVADQDLNAGNELAGALTKHMVAATICPDGAQALYLAGSDPPDAVLTAAGLPVIGGADVAKGLSIRTGIPVLVGTTTNDGPEAMAALAAGATACVFYPYQLNELVSILEAICHTRPSLPEAPPLVCGGLRLDPAAMLVHLHGRPVRMPMQELRLLQLLMTQQGRVVRIADIHDAIWSDQSNSNTIAVHIKRLRCRLGDKPFSPKIIHTIRGVGYRLEAPPIVEELTA